MQNQLKKILIIEDNLDHIERYIYLLKSSYHLFITQTYVEAIDIINSEYKSIDLIITDWELNDPAGDGLDVIQFIYRNLNNEIKDIPIIMSTAYTSSHKLDDAFKHGAYDYLRKPINSTELKARVEAAINRTFMMRKIKVLLMAANPKGTDFLQINKEFKRIKDELKIKGKDRDLFDVEFELELTKNSLFRSLESYQPSIVHFSGHGEDDAIALTGDDGLHVPLENFAEIINAFAEQYSIKCVIVNACNSEDIIRSINPEKTFAIGTNVSIFDSIAIQFSEGFYLSLASGNDFETSYKRGLLYANTKNYTSNINQ